MTALFVTHVFVQVVIKLSWSYGLTNIHNKVVDYLYVVVSCAKFT